METPGPTLVRGVDYSVVDPTNKWRMLKSQWRFALWCMSSHPVLPSCSQASADRSLAALWISTGVVMQGFDIVAGGQLAALPVFVKKFGVLRSDGSYLIPAHYLSAWNAIAPACEIAATPIFAPLLEKFGRKWGILAASVISTAGIILMQLADDWKVHLAGRGVNGEIAPTRLTPSSCR